MTMAKRVRVYSMAIVIVVTTLFIAQQFSSLRTEYRATKSINENRGTAPARFTADLGLWKGNLPLTRPIVNVASIPTDSNGYAASYEGEVVGGYRWGSGNIFVTSQASERILVHEFGHAVTFDAVVLYCDGDVHEAIRITFDTLMDFDRESDASELPTALRDVAIEYQAIPTEVYGNAYYTERLSEYIAQSFALYTAGQTVPPVVGEWLMELENDGGR